MVIENYEINYQIFIKMSLFENKLALELEKCLKEGKYNKAITLINENEYLKDIQLGCSEVIAAAVQFLTEDNFKNNPELFSAGEIILKGVAGKANKEDVLFELLEIIEVTRDDEVLTSLLKAMQVVLLRIDHRKSQAIGWVLDSISNYIKEINLPKELRLKLGEEEEDLIENVPEVKRLLSLYLTLFLFIEPVQEKLLATKYDTKSSFHFHGFNSKNVMTTFLLQTMGGTFAVLKFKREKEGKAKTYSRQCAETLMHLLLKSCKDPFSLLNIVEERIIYRSKRQQSLEEMPDNIFLIEERTSLLSYAMLYYFIFVEQITIAHVPKVYHPSYLIDKTLLLVLVLFSQEETNLHYKGIQLSKALFNTVPAGSLKINDLFFDTVKDFLSQLSQIVVFSPIQRNRKEGIELLLLVTKSHSFDAQYTLVTCLFNSVDNDGLLGYTIMLYKNILVALFNQDLMAVKEYFSAKRFKALMMQHVCVVKDREKVDLMDNKDKILGALNLLMFLFLRDKENDTQVWDFTVDIERQFLEPLRKAIDLSRAHYKYEHRVVQESPDIIDESAVEKLQICIQNDDEDPNLLMTKEKKLEFITYALNTFDVMENLLVRVNECIEHKNKT